MARLCFSLIVLWLDLSAAYKILVVFPIPGKSHGILGDGHVRWFLEAGHEVTYVTAFPGKFSHANYSEIDVSDNMRLMPTQLINIRAIMDKEVNINDLSALLNMTVGMGNNTLRNKNMQKLMNDPNTEFDVVLIEWMFSEVYVGLSAVFNCPYVWFTSTEPAWMQLSMIDESLNPAYSPDPLSTAVPPFDFKQRVLELWYLLTGQSFKKWYMMPAENKVYESIYGEVMRKKGKSLPSLDELRLNASLMLGNSHVSMGSSIRLPQSYKPIGGYHINPEVKPLPEDLKKIMDDSKYGVIYFSMGSNLKSKDMPDEMKQSLLNMFGELKYTIIWKLEETFGKLPKNVHVLKWAPQPSILSHPKCILFITHGGLLSTTETVHFGVPIIGIPTFADQFVNVMRATKKGYARKVDLGRKMATDLKRNIQEILDDPRYAAKAKELSMIYHDRVASPGAELVHWVEHVVRTRGATHLRSPALHVPLYQKLYLDLAALLLAAALLLRATLKLLLRLIYTKNYVSETDNPEVLKTRKIFLIDFGIRNCENIERQRLQDIRKCQSVSELNFGIAAENHFLLNIQHFSNDEFLGTYSDLTSFISEAFR